MIRTQRLGMLICADTRIGIDSVGVPVFNQAQLGAPLTISRIAFFGITGLVIIIESRRALISVMSRPRSRETPVGTARRAIPMNSS